jgi:hypothetical protein
MVFILPPLVLVMVQLHAFYGFRGLQPGDSAQLTVVLDETWQDRWGDDRPPVTLDLPAGLNEETPAIWVPELGEFSWQIGAVEWGNHRVTLHVGDHTIDKNLRVTESVTRLSPTRPDGSFLGQLEWPSESPIPGDLHVREIRLGYPDGSVGLAGWVFQWSYAWMVVFFVLTMIIAVALKGPLGVEL